MIAGHESSGIVAAVGEEVTSLGVGDWIVLSLLRSCRRCFYCTMGSPFLCTGQFALSKESRVHDRQGKPILQGLYTGSFAEQTIVDQSQCVKIPDEIPFDRAALLACGVITGLGAVTNTAKIAARSSIAVIGIGGVGLNAIQGALLSGATQIIAIDRIEGKLASAKTFGATHTINAAEEDPVTTAIAISGGLGVDYAFVTVGSSKALEQGFMMTRKGGTTVMVGIPNANDPLTLTARHFLYDRKMIGSRMGSTRLSIDIPRLVDLYLQGKLKLDELITKRYRLEEINEAIASTESDEALRNVILLDYIPTIL